jgi:hypothetical protein
MRLVVELDGHSEFGPCECCGHTSRRVWGYLHDDDATRAAYLVTWTPGHLDHDPAFELIVGRWGEGATAADRVRVALRCRFSGSGPQFMVVDAARGDEARRALAAAELTRAQVVGTPLATDIFAMVDAIWLGDARLGEFTGAGV